MKNFQCGNCNGQNVRTEWALHNFKYGEGSAAADLTTRLPFRVCLDCKFRFTDDEADNLIHEAICRYLGIMTPEEIMQIRNHYKMSRKEFVDLSRVGDASLARWETGALMQNGSTDNYLYLLSIPANIERLQSRDAHAPLNLITRTITTNAEYKFRCLNGEELERKKSVGITFQLRPV